MLYYFYGRLVLASHHPHIVLFLGLLWAGLLGLLCWSVWKSLPSCSFRSCTNVLVLPLGLFAYLLCTARNDEALFWPAGAVAYIPTLAAVFMVFLVTACSSLRTMSSRRLCCLAFWIALTSSETGAIIVFALALVYAADMLWERRHRGSRHGTVAWWAWPGAASAVVLGVMYTNRFRDTEPTLVIAGPLHNHALVSLLVAVRVTALQLLGPRLAVTTEPHALLLGAGSVALQFAFAIGFALQLERYWGASTPDPRQFLRTAVAFTLASIAISASSLMHFGQLCCSRHQTLRNGLLICAFCGASAAWLARRRTRAGQPAGSWSLTGPLLMVSAVLPGALYASPAVLHDIRLEQEIGRAREATYASGISSASSTMTFLLPPYTRFIGQYLPAPGVYEFSREPVATLPFFVLQYFRKDRMVVARGNNITP